VFSRLPEVIWTDKEQFWRQKLVLNIITWFICVCAVFVIAALGNLICLT